jgi:hypothetical protein
MTTQQIQEQIFDLRNKQANCTPAERQTIQQMIVRLYAILDKLSK